MKTGKYRITRLHPSGMVRASFGRVRVTGNVQVLELSG